MWYLHSKKLVPSHTYRSASNQLPVLRALNCCSHVRVLLLSSTVLVLLHFCHASLCYCVFVLLQLPPCSAHAPVISATSSFLLCLSAPTISRSCSFHTASSFYSSIQLVEQLPLLSHRYITICLHNQSNIWTSCKRLVTQLGAPSPYPPHSA